MFDAHKGLVGDIGGAHEAQRRFNAGTRRYFGQFKLIRLRRWKAHSRVVCHSRVLKCEESSESGPASRCLANASEANTRPQPHSQRRQDRPFRGCLCLAWRRVGDARAPAPTAAPSPPVSDAIPDFSGRGRRSSGAGRALSRLKCLNLLRLRSSLLKTLQILRQVIQCKVKKKCRACFQRGRS